LKKYIENGSWGSVTNQTGTISAGRLKKAGIHLLSVFESPLWSFLLALIVYGILTPRHSGIALVSDFPYYNYLADAFLHGQLSLRLIPEVVHDLVHFAGKYYL
jgi:hypothetical protein